MTRIRIRAVAALAAAVTAIAVPAMAASLPGAARAAKPPESIFQDDDHLIYSDSATVARVLDLLKRLGVDRIRVTIEWKALAPDATSTTEPAGFNAADPAAYTSTQFDGSPGVWEPYDRVIEMAAARGISVDFNVTAPGPLWAMQPAPITTQYGTRPIDHYYPSAKAFGDFVQAVGTRYSGTYVPPTPAPPTTTTPNPPPITIPLLTPPPTTTTTTTPTPTPLPRVDYWSIWNEPDQPGWLAPQWRTVRKQRVPNSPRLYRGLVRAAVGALDVTGHTLSSDTILVGETAPEGAVTPFRAAGQVRYRPATGFYQAMTPMVFLRALYCVNGSYRRLTGKAARALGCPLRGSRRAFVSQNPGLFYATGFAHHPYYFSFPPDYSTPIADFVPLADLGRLQRGLDRVYAVYRVHRRIPIYLTEYGYQTNPPDPYQVVSPAKQAIYLNQADYMAWRNHRVRSVAQFLLYDSGPNSKFPPSSFDYWNTFQTGLLFGPGTSLEGRRKPAYAAYRLPIWIPARQVRPGAKMFIWGMLRLAPKDSAQQALIQWRRPRRRAKYRTLATVNVSASGHGYFTTRVRPRSSGYVRIAWVSAAGNTFASRAVAVTVGASSSPSRQSGPAGATPLTPVR